MSLAAAENVKHAVFATLKDTPFEVTDLLVLSGGYANFTLRGTLKTPLDDADKSEYILIKHGESYAQWDSNVLLPVERCEIEVKALQAVAAMHTSAASAAISTPCILFHSASFQTHAQTYFPHGASLRTYLSTHLAQPSFSPDQHAAIRSFAAALGAWLTDFHAWANNTPARTALAGLAEKNSTLQTMKWHLNYGSLARSKTAFPEALDCLSDEDITAIMSSTREEIAASRTIIHGDFWTGNTIVSDIPFSLSTPLTAFIVDWEMLSFGPLAMDVGQMLAEFYLLFLFRDISASLIMSQGFISAYTPSIAPQEKESFAFRTLLHLGGHLIGVPPMVQEWDDTRRQKVAKEGAQIVKAAWSKDREFFRGHALESLFP